MPASDCLTTENKDLMESDRQVQFKISDQDGQIKIECNVETE